MSFIAKSQPPERLDPVESEPIKLIRSESSGCAESDHKTIPDEIANDPLLGSLIRGEKVEADLAKRRR